MRISEIRVDQKLIRINATISTKASSALEHNALAAIASTVFSRL